MSDYIRRLPDGHLELFSLPPGVPYALCEAARAATHRQLQATDLNGLKLGEAFVKYVIRDPKVRACVEWLSAECPEKFKSLFQSSFPPPPNGCEPPAIKGYTWPAMLDANKLCRDIACVAGHRYYEPPTDHTLDWDSFYQTARALADAHKAFIEVLADPALVAVGLSDRTKVTNPTHELIRADHCLDVQNGDLLEAGRRILKGITLRAGASQSPVRHKHKRPKHEKLAIALKRHGLDKDSKGKTTGEISHLIRDEMECTTELQLDALRKAIERYYKRARL